jgi:hypothetical protein
MKKAILYSLAIILVSCKTTAQPSQGEAQAENKTYVQLMETNIKSLDTVTGPQSFMAIANSFERIAKAEKNKWEPYYYAAYCYGVMASKADKNSIDKLADMADKYLDAARQLNDNAEISVVAAMIIANRILVDPMSRYMERGKEVIALLEKAKHQDPKNPRPYYLQARFLVKVPEGLGGGNHVATALLETAIEKFKIFSAPNSLAPNWGYDKTLAMLEELRKQ